MTALTGVLYKDKLVKVTAENLTLHNYYFFGCGKVIPVEDIKVIKSVKPDMMTGQWRIWGAGWFGMWAPLDWNRPSRDRIYHLFYKDRKFVIGFTVENSALAESVFGQLGLLERDF
jgi:hypothetical protein